MIEYFFFIHYNFALISLLFFQLFILRIFKRNNKGNKSKNKFYSKIITIIIFIINFIIIYFLFNFRIKTIIIQSLIIFVIYNFLSNKFSLYGITGQIASGKSTVTEYLKRKYNARIINIDDINREVLSRNEVINEIEKVFGNSVIKIENNRKILDKQLIKSLIFEDPKKKKKLEMITHPKVFMSFAKIVIDEKFIKNNKYVFIENAILLRFKIFVILCKIILCICVKDENILIDRIIKRDNCTEETARNILKNQMTLKQFEEGSDYVLYNDKDYKNIENEIDNIINEIEQ